MKKDRHYLGETKPSSREGQRRQLRLERDNILGEAQTSNEARKR